MSQSTTMTIRLEAELKERLDRLSEATHRSRSFLAEEAIRAFIALNEWQIQELQKAIKEAEEGDFASAQEVTDVFQKWVVDAD